MPSPFPGMDPYLENRRLWPVFHKAFISSLMFDLNEVLPEGFVASQDERVYLAPVDREVQPDVAVIDSGPSEPPRGGTPLLVEDPPFVLEPATEEVCEPFITILTAGAEQEVVTVMEVLSPKNKYRSRNGRTEYLAKQRRLKGGSAHLIEIDLLRGGEHTVAVELDRVEALGAAFDCLVSLHRAGRGEAFEVWPVSLHARLPRIRVPLAAGHPDLIFDLQAPFTRAFDGGRFASRIDYGREPTPRLSRAEREWADALLRAAGRR